MMLPASGTTVAERHHPVRAALNLLSCVRIREVLVLQGTPLLGALFSMRHLTAEGYLTLALLVAGSTLLVAHVFVLNDWAGIGGDLRDPNRIDDVFTSRGIQRRAIVCFSLVLLSLGLLLLVMTGSSTLWIAVAIVGLSALYSFPRVHAKGIPVLSSVLHLAGGLLHFLLGYSVFSAPDWRGIQIGSFFALVFVAGHLTHETRDRDSDQTNEIRTNAVMFGKIRSFIGGLVLFAAADVLLMTLALYGTVPRSLAFVVLICPLHVYWSLKAIRGGLTFESIRQLQTRYRALYAAAGLWFAVVLMLAR